MTVPAKAGMSTDSGSANETPDPEALAARADEVDEARRDALSRANRSVGPIAVIWYGGADRPS